MTAADTLILAVPSKGRLQENAAAFFARAGLTFAQARGERDYRGRIAELPNVEVAYLSASEIAQQLASGGAHLGVTGEDLVREQIPDAAERLEILTPLGFGAADVVVAVPQAWIDVRRMADLEEVAAVFHTRAGARRMRVATKYIHLTRRFFTEKGVGDYRIVESLGATEGAPAAGQAEIIVDITTTGATLRANALKVLEDGVILRSQANLVASMRAAWTETTRGAARAILSRIEAEEQARLTREARALVADPEACAAEAAALFGARAPFGFAGGGPLTLVCARADVAALADWLVRRGADHVAVSAPDYVFLAQAKLYEALASRIG